MSYARFGWDGSDVYVFASERDGEHGIECGGCDLDLPHLRSLATRDLTPDEAVDTWRDGPPSTPGGAP